MNDRVKKANDLIIKCKEELEDWADYSIHQWGDKEVLTESVLDDVDEYLNG